ncbi:hypothetical protein FJZ26_05080, partial [Candidatus Parvarchaeota archaeon]|nr:hypothetical protein [Candidatus Parvarchaeota archaeon]
MIMVEGMDFGPKSVALDLHIAPADLFSVLCEHEQIAFLFESSKGVEKLSRFSFLGFGPSKHMVLDGGALNVSCGKDGQSQALDATDPLGMLKSQIGRADVSAEGFLGGAVGYFSFDFVNHLEPTLADFAPKNPAGFPDYEFGVFDDCIVFDHRVGTIKYLYRA